MGRKQGGHRTSDLQKRKLKVIKVIKLEELRAKNFIPAFFCQYKVFTPNKTNILLLLNTVKEKKIVGKTDKERSINHAIFS